MVWSCWLIAGFQDINHRHPTKIWYLGSDTNKNVWLLVCPAIQTFIVTWQCAIPSCDLFPSAFLSMTSLSNHLVFGHYYRDVKYFLSIKFCCAPLSINVISSTSSGRIVIFIRKFPLSTANKHSVVDFETTELIKNPLTPLLFLYLLFLSTV